MDAPKTSAVILLILLLIVIIFKRVNTFEVIQSEDNMIIVNFVKVAEGQILQKNNSLVSRKLASSEKECYFLCTGEPPCLSVNVIPQISSSFLCEFFNWTAINVNGLLVPKRKSYYSSLKV